MLPERVADWEDQPEDKRLEYWAVFYILKDAGKTMVRTHWLLGCPPQSLGAIRVKREHLELASSDVSSSLGLRGTVSDGMPRSVAAKPVVSPKKRWAEIQKPDAPEQPKRDASNGALRVAIDSKDRDGTGYASQGDSDDEDEMPTVASTTPKTPSKSKKRRRNLHFKEALARLARGAVGIAPKRAKLAVWSNNATLGYTIGWTFPCREDEFDLVLGSPCGIFGLWRPGDGKTPTVHAVVRELKRMAECNKQTSSPMSKSMAIMACGYQTSIVLCGRLFDVAKEGHLCIAAKESLKARTAHLSSGGGT
ncbi:hypothetical protein FB451DRAFT_1367593 [Mycena latifolia]|nr:hypothetical protein FB451DRAFT_1367593 [Mycena latifolia]